MWPTVFDAAKLKETIRDLHTKQSQPNFWNDNEEASRVTKELAAAQDQVDMVERWQGTVLDQSQLLAMIKEEKDDNVAQDLARQLDGLDKQVSEQERLLQFSGPYDAQGAIVTIQSGAGGTDAQDWAEMLERMYMRFAEGRTWKVISIERSVGEEAGIKSSTFEVAGNYAFGTLKNERGVHRLVRLSPFNSDNLRQTSFARVEIIPKLDAKQAPEIDEKDLVIDTFRAGGAGGQHVNKTSSAVRIRHIPTGLVVKCQNERSQAQNKQMAMSVLQAKLVVLAESQHVKEVKDLRGEYKQPAWGNQIRSYVLHPYTMVKDHRTNTETSDVQAVLNGDLTLFLG